MCHMTLSWRDRLDLVKVFVLPRFLFYFRALPINYPTSCLQVWQSTLNNFIWSKKKARTPLNTLCKPLLKGGVAYPNLTFYNKAAQLVNIFKILQASEKIDWVTIEQFLPSHSLSMKLLGKGPIKDLFLCITTHFYLVLYLYVIPAETNWHPFHSQCLHSLGNPGLSQCTIHPLLLSGILTIFGGFGI